MRNKKNQIATGKIESPHHGQGTAPGARRRGLWHRLPAALKIVLTLPVVMALLGAEIELRLAPQLDLVLTVIGVCAIWAWLSGGPSSVV